MIKYVLIALFALSSFALTAQELSPEDNIAMLPFKAINSQRILAAELAEAAVHEAVIGSKQVSIVERSAFSELENEKWRQSDVDFTDGEVVSKTRSIGANRILFGQITLCDISSSRSKTTGNYTYKCGIKLFIRLIDVETSRVLASETWEYNTGMVKDPLSGSDTEKGAIAYSAAKLMKDAEKFLDENYPMTGRIVRVEADGRLLLNMGTLQGIQEKDKLIVYTSEIIKDIEGVYEQQIGEITIEEVNGPNSSTAKVKGKNKDLIAKGMASGIILLVKTKS